MLQQRSTEQVEGRVVERFPRPPVEISVIFGTALPGLVRLEQGTGISSGPRCSGTHIDEVGHVVRRGEVYGEMSADPDIQRVTWEDHSPLAS